MTSNESHPAQLHGSQLHSDADQASLRAADSAARERAVREFSEPVVLEAGAGTGKTTTLVARVVTWAAGPGWELAHKYCATDSPDPEPERVARRVWSGLVMITFTEAAAAEMAARAGEALEHLAAGELNSSALTGIARDLLPADGELALRASALAEAVDQLQAQTIHGYCARLLRANALNAGLHPSFEIDADQERSEELVREVVEEWLAELFGETASMDAESASATRALIARGWGPEAWVEATLSGLAVGLDDVQLEGDGEAAWDRGCAEIEVRMLDASKQLAALLAPAVSDFKASDVFVRLFGAAHLAAEEGIELQQRFDRVLELAAKNKTQLDQLAKGTPKAAVVEALGAGLASAGLAADALRKLAKQAEQLDRNLHLAARRVLVGLLGRARDRRRRRGVLTYDDLLTEAVRLLKEGPGGDVLDRVRGDLDQLLVDEFQDTSRVQCELVQLLAFGRSTDSSERVGQPGLFLVGDPKQSIYAFRGAELRAYQSFKSALPGGDRVVSTLSVNYRSSQAVLDEVERLVEPCMEAIEGLQPRFQRLVASEDPGSSTRLPDGLPAVELWSAESEGDALNADTAVRLEAEAIAEDLLRVGAAGVAYADCAILLRSLPQVSLFVDALKRRGVPFTVGKDRSYFKRREVIEAVALLRCLIDPTDGLTVASFLRSSAVGLPDLALAALLRQGFATEAPRLIGEDHAVDQRIQKWVALARDAAESSPLSESAGLDRLGPWWISFEAGLRFLARWRARLEVLDVPRWLAGLRAELAFECGESTRFLGSYRAANLTRLFDEVERECQARGGDLLGLARRLQRMLSDDNERNDARPEGGGDPGVQLMSIHGSKGLGFRCVYLAQVQKGRSSGGRDEHAFARNEELGDGGWALKLCGAPSPAWCLTESAQERIEAAERVRLLYVALTRAKARLVVSGGWTRDLKAADWAQADGLGQLIAWRLAFDDSIEGRSSLPSGDTGDLQSEASGVHWRRYRSVAAAADGLAAESQLDLERASADAQGLLQARRSAEERRQRVRIATASSDVHVALEKQRAEQPDRWRDEYAGQQAPVRFGPGDAEAARLAGTAIHQLFERWDGSAESLSKVQAQLRESLGSLVGGSHREASLARFDALAESLQTSELGRHFAGLQERIVARELSVVLPGEHAEGAGGPTEAWTGAIDLVHREGSAWVIVDYKSDALDPDDLAERAEVYRPQLERYGRALESALGLEAPPKLELWFLHLDQRVEL